MFHPEILMVYLKKKGEKINKNIILFYLKKIHSSLNENICPLFSMSRGALKQCPCWEANVIHGFSRKGQVPANHILKLFPSYLTCKVEIGLVPPKMPCLEGVPG